MRWTQNLLFAGVLLGPSWGCMLLGSSDDYQLGRGGSAADAPSSNSAGGMPGSGAAGAGSNSGGSGAAAGAGGGGNASCAPCDWSSAMSALYLFDEGAFVGTDSSGHGATLSDMGHTELATDEFMQGTAALEIIAQEAVTQSSDPVFTLPAGASVTMGGWIRITGESGGGLYLLSAGSTPELRLTREAGTGGATGRAVCLAGNQVDTDPSLAPGLYNHFVCRFDAAASSLSIFTDGLLHDTGVGIIPEERGGKFEVFSPNTGSVGYPWHFDEVFFVAAALSDAAIKRIWACDVKGVECACDAADATQYTHCGRAEGMGAGCNTIGLSPCNAPAPEAT